MISYKQLFPTFYCLDNLLGAVRKHLLDDDDHYYDAVVVHDIDVVVDDD